MPSNSNTFVTPARPVAAQPTKPNISTTQPPVAELSPQRNVELVKASALESLWVGIGALCLVCGIALVGEAFGAWAGDPWFTVQVAMGCGVLATAVALLANFALTLWRDVRFRVVVMARIDDLQDENNSLKREVAFWKRESAKNSARSAQAERGKVDVKVRPSNELIGTANDAKQLIELWRSSGEKAYKRDNCNLGEKHSARWDAATGLLMRAGVMVDRGSRYGKTFIVEEEFEATRLLNEQVEEEARAAQESRVVA